MRVAHATSLKSTRGICSLNGEEFMDEKTFEKQYARAKEAGQRANATEPRASSARYDSLLDKIIIRLRNGEEFAFSPDLVPGLRGASPGDLSEVEVTPSGEGLHWEGLDEDLSVPALIKGVYGPQAAEEALPLARFAVEFPETLCAEIEVAWTTRRDNTVVDRLAAEHPDQAELLYDFFALLIANELAPSATREDLEHSTARTTEWLEAEGFALARKVAREESLKTLTSSSTPPTPPADQASAVRKGAPDEGGSTGAPATGLAYIGLVQERTGRDIDEVTDLAPIIRFVQRQPVNEFKRVRKEIVKVGAERWGINEEEGEQSLSLPMRAAASRKSDAKPMTYEKVVERSRLSVEDKKFWLKLGSEEED
jgi:hypothetical protein